MLCYAMLCYAMRRRGLGCAVALAVDVQAYKRIRSDSYSYEPRASPKKSTSTGMKFSRLGCGNGCSLQSALVKRKKAKRSACPMGVPA